MEPSSLPFLLVFFVSLVLSVSFCPLSPLIFLVLFFLFITYQDSELLAQQCMEPEMVPICGDAGNEAFCNKNCDSSAFCCPLTMDVNCNVSYNDLCNFTECKGDNEGAIFQVQACDDTREVRECSDEEMTREPCSGCSRGAFCCPILGEDSKGACNATYNGVCQGNCKGINQESICRVPEVRPESRLSWNACAL